MQAEPTINTDKFIMNIAEVFLHWYSSNSPDWMNAFACIHLASSTVTLIPLAVKKHVAICVKYTDQQCTTQICMYIYNLTTQSQGFWAMSKAKHTAKWYFNKQCSIKSFYFTKRLHHKSLRLNTLVNHLSLCTQELIINHWNIVNKTIAWTL